MTTTVLVIAGLIIAFRVARARQLARKRRTGEIPVYSNLVRVPLFFSMMALHVGVMMHFMCMAADDQYLALPPYFVTAAPALSAAGVTMALYGALGVVVFTFIYERGFEADYFKDFLRQVGTQGGMFLGVVMVCALSWGFGKGFMIDEGARTDLALVQMFEILMAGGLAAIVGLLAAHNWDDLKKRRIVWTIAEPPLPALPNAPAKAVPVIITAKAEVVHD